MLPKEALHITDLSEVVPSTEAVNGSVPVVIEEAVEGETVTEVTTAVSRRFADSAEAVHPAVQPAKAVAPKSIGTSALRLICIIRQTLSGNITVR
jgi:hypothetical protein